MMVTRYLHRSAHVSAALAFLVAMAWTPLACAQRVFETPEAAAKALIDAAKANDENALVDIFGEKHRSLVGTVDDAADQENRESFAQDAAEYLLLRKDGDDKITLVVGFEAWPFPIPLVHESAGWQFDTAAGSDEILNRRIGRDELSAIKVLQAYVGAQREYASETRDGGTVREFARKIASSPGKHDGLYWPADAESGDETSPFGPLIHDPDKRKAGDPYNGYYFKILTRQGAGAPGGAYSYVINGRMLAGFAMVAAPAQYGQTGIKTFMVNHYGDVYERDFGPKTSQTFKEIIEYNPTSEWHLVQ